MMKSTALLIALVAWSKGVQNTNVREESELVSLSKAAIEVSGKQARRLAALETASLGRSGHGRGLLTSDRSAVMKVKRRYQHMKVQEALQKQTLQNLVPGGKAEAARQAAKSPILRKETRDLESSTPGQPAKPLTSQPALITRRDRESTGASGAVPRRLPVPPPASNQPAHLSQCSALPPFQPAEHLTHFNEFLESNWAGKHASPTLRSVTEYLSYLYPYVACVPPTLPSVLSRPEAVQYSCSGEFWAGPRPKPLKVVSFVPFGYEMDILEVRLHEHEDVVDLMVLSESVYTHRVQRKPLFYERGKERFKRFHDNILHVIDDEAVLFPERNVVSKTHDDWRNDIRKLGYPWDRFLQAMRLKGPNDPRLADYLFVASDMDELPSAEQLAHFKYCRPAKPAKHYLLGARFFQHNFRWWKPQNGEPKSFEYSSTVTEGSSIRGSKTLPYRPRPRTQEMVAFYSEHPGWVLNRFFGPYVDMFKELALAEGGNIPQHRNQTLAVDPTLAKEWHAKGIRTCCRGDAKSVQPSPSTHKPPWFARLNNARFPYMFPR